MTRVLSDNWSVTIRQIQLDNNPPAKVVSAVGEVSDPDATNEYEKGPHTVKCSKLIYDATKTEAQLCDDAVKGLKECGGIPVA